VPVQFWVPHVQATTTVEMSTAATHEEFGELGLVLAAQATPTVVQAGAGQSVPATPMRLPSGSMN
jgi:hypothetical protein